MRVNVLGGGPGGLYSAILLQKRFPDARIEVFERNAADQTWGWGVVFSDETMSGFELADRESHDAITKCFARWDAIDVFAKGQHIRSQGHGFCGIARKKLLHILQERAKELGVVCHFQAERVDIETLRADCDLLIAADGVRSLARKQYEHVFRPSFDPRKCRYIWLGTTHLFPAFTFSFRENAHGLFQIHAYRFDAGHSTVIVECDEESWRNAGLDRADEATSLAYCEALFAEELSGHRLLSNRSTWVQFQTLKNDRWWHENVVLVGDAAHTAHFSIGSGTKLAMEDAIGLAEAMGRFPGDVPRALEAYETERKPMAGRIQTAAQQSLEWFENAKRHHRLEPIQMVFSLMTRSRRITHENLRKRDPSLVERADRWFEARAGVVAGERAVPPMFTPFRLRAMTLANRVVVSPMCMYSAIDGVPNDFHLVHLGSRALGGAGLLMTEMTNVSAEGRITPGCTGIWNEAQASAWKRIVDFVHERSSARIGLQLGHAGRKGSTKALWEGPDVPLERDNWELLAPSPIPYDPKKGSQVPRAMTRLDMDLVLEQFERATHLTLAAGFDLIEVHMAHGYLLSSFLTPLSNQRTDAYGGSLANRLRFPLEVLDVVRRVWPADKPLAVRISAVDWVPGGLEIDDAVAIARALKEHGADVIDVSSGQTSPDAKPVFGRSYQTPFSERIRNDVGIPTIAVGNVGDHDQINSILLAGRADLVALARPHLSDPHFTLHAAAALEHPVAWPPQYLLGAPMPKR
ncbi:MAG: bifunctional salicylyl-CoA 5-hydroxylase/oxidoreductase [Sandaracinaceae bacterium]